MITKIDNHFIFFNNIKNIEEEYHYVLFTYLNYKERIRDFNNINSDEDIIKELDKLLIELNTSRLVGNKQLYTTTCFTYNKKVGLYNNLLFRLSNHLLQAEYSVKLIELHERNIVFDYSYDCTNNHRKESVNKSSKKNNKPNKFIRQETTDLFTDKTTYIYQNLKTGEIIKSDNPDLLDELNKKKKKEKKEKINTKVANIAFNFNLFKK